MSLSILLIKLCFSCGIKVKNITPKNPVNAHVSDFKPIIGTRCKTTECVGDSFLTRMGWLAQAYNLFNFLIFLLLHKIYSVHETNNIHTYKKYSNNKKTYYNNGLL